MNFYDILLARCLCCNGGVEAEPLNVTENGTYTADEGKAFNPVTVNVSGGNSDFSTAQVTFISNASNQIVAILAIANEAMPPIDPNPGTRTDITLCNGDELTVTAVLYKGYCNCRIQGASALSGEGDVTISLNDAKITGDCTITIS